MNLILQRAHLVGCGGSADIGPQAGHNVALMHVVEGEMLGFKGGGIGNPELHLRLRISEPAGQNTDDLVWRAIQPYLLSNDGRVSCETPLEEAPGKQNHVVGRGLVFLRSERASQRRLNAQD
jgi:hypothetical protein